MKTDRTWIDVTGSLALLVLLALAAPGCRKTRPAASQLAFAYDLKTENKYFNTQKKAPYRFFYRGWRGNTGNAISPRPQLRFFHYSEADSRRIHLQIINPRPSESRSIKAILNGKLLQELFLEGKKGEFSLTLLRPHLKRGENILELQTEELHRSLTDLRRQSEPKDYFLLNNIFFEGPPPPGEESGRQGEEGFIQPAGSVFSLAADPSRSRRIELVLKSGKAKTPGNLICRSREPDGRLRILKEIPLKPGQNHQIDLALDEYNQPLVVEIEYTCRDRRSLLTWERIQKIPRPTQPPGREKIAPRSPPGKPLPPQPHVFIIVIDAARYDSVNRVVDGKLTTPRIREFSEISCNYSRFYANAPYTIASVATLLSGFLPEVHTIRDMDLKLPERCKTMPDYFEEIGYRTTGITSNVPLFRTNLLRDFEKVVICRAFGEPRYQNYSFVDLKIVNKTIRETPFDTPQLFYIHLLPPHTPYNPPRTAFDRFVQYPNGLFKTYRNKVMRELYRRAEQHNIFDPDFNDFLYQAYLNNLYYADFLVGLLLETLREKGIFDDSLIIVTSDHGEAFFEHRKYTHNSTSYNEMIHIPFIMKLPGQRSGRTIHSTHSLVDLLPTLGQLLGLKGNRRWQGHPFPPAGNGGSGSDPFPLYSRANGPEYNLSLIMGAYKYLYYSGREELYHLDEDPGEKNCILKDRPYLAAFLREEAFRQLIRNLQLRKELKITELKEGKDPQEVIRELETLGYL